MLESDAVIAPRSYPHSSPLHDGINDFFPQNRCATSPRRAVLCWENGGRRRPWSDLRLLPLELRSHRRSCAPETTFRPQRGCAPLFFCSWYVQLPAYPLVWNLNFGICLIYINKLLSYPLLNTKNIPFGMNQGLVRVDQGKGSDDRVASRSGVA